MVHFFIRFFVIIVLGSVLNLTNKAFSHQLSDTVMCPESLMVLSSSTSVAKAVQNIHTLNNLMVLHEKITPVFEKLIGELARFRLIEGVAINADKVSFEKLRKYAHQLHEFVIAYSSRMYKAFVSIVGPRIAQKMAFKHALKMLFIVEHVELIAHALDRQHNTLSDEKRHDLLQARIDLLSSVYLMLEKLELPRAHKVARELEERISCLRAQNY